MFVTTQIYPDLSAIAYDYSGILLDAYGVFWGGNQLGPLDGALNEMERLVLNGKIVGILSNSTQSAQSETQKFARHQLIQGKHFHFIITSAELTRQLLVKQKIDLLISHHKYLLMFEEHPKFPLNIFENTSFKLTQEPKSADFIYISTPHLDGQDQTDPKVFKELIKSFVPTKLPMLCANPDHYAHEGNPARLVVRQGSIAALYQEMGGQVIYVGKPCTFAYEVAMEKFQTFGVQDKKQVLMVGDTPETDSLGAKNFGMPCALITQTGIFAERIKNQSLDSFYNEIPKEHLPTFFVERLGR